MKVRFVVFAITLLLITSATTLGQERLRLTRYIYGQKYTIKVFDEDFETMLSWNPETEEAPLSVRMAIEVSQRNLARFISKDTEKWVLDKVTLSQPCKTKWLYEVEFLNLDLLGSEMDMAFTIFVRMDGTIVEPEIVPNDGKLRVY